MVARGQSIIILPYRCLAVICTNSELAEGIDMSTHGTKQTLIGLASKVRKGLEAVIRCDGEVVQIGSTSVQRDEEDLH